MPRNYRITYSQGGEVGTVKIKSYSRYHAKLAFSAYNPAAAVLKVDEEGCSGTLLSRNAPARRHLIRERLISDRMENLRKARASDE